MEFAWDGSFWDEMNAVSKNFCHTLCTLDIFTEYSYSRVCTYLFSAKKSDTVMSNRKSENPSLLRSVHTCTYNTQYVQVDYMDTPWTLPNASNQNSTTGPISATLERREIFLDVHHKWSASDSAAAVRPTSIVMSLFAGHVTVSYSLPGDNNYNNNNNYTWTAAESESFHEIIDNQKLFW